MFEIYYKKDDPIHRNKKKTVFVNPGSVGQPRNLCACAQYTIWETENDTFEMKRYHMISGKNSRIFRIKLMCSTKTDWRSGYNESLCN